MPSPLQTLIANVQRRYLEHWPSDEQFARTDLGVAIEALAAALVTEGPQPETTDFEQALVCWDCGTPLVMHDDGAEKPCGHTGTMVLSRAEYRRLKGPLMPEPPDFEQIARDFSERAFPSAVVTVPKPEWETRREMIAGLAEQLRLVWNARGAADIEAAATCREPAGKSDMEDLVLAIRSVDR